MRIQSYDDQLLHLAADLAQRLLPAFDTPTGYYLFYYYNLPGMTGYILHQTFDSIFFHGFCCKRIVSTGQELSLGDTHGITNTQLHLMLYSNKT